MNIQEANSILHSLTAEKRKEAAMLYNFLAQQMKEGNFKPLTSQQKLMIMFAFAVEYGRRNKDNNRA